MTTLNSLPKEQRIAIKRALASMIPPGACDRRAELRTYLRTWPAGTVDRLLALLRRAETSLLRWHDRVLWPWLEAALTGKSCAGRWYALYVATLLTLVVVSQFVMWWGRVGR